jgi:hypothetical protein
MLQVSQVYKIAPKVLTEHGKTKSKLSSSAFVPSHQKC